MGAWIETGRQAKTEGYWSVAPFMGAWIETGSLLKPARLNKVAPFMGSWIDTIYQFDFFISSLFYSIFHCHCLILIKRVNFRLKI